MFTRSDKIKWRVNRPVLGDSDRFPKIIFFHYEPVGINFVDFETGIGISHSFARAVPVFFSFFRPDCLTKKKPFIDKSRDFPGNSNFALRLRASDVNLHVRYRHVNDIDHLISLYNIIK